MKERLFKRKIYTQLLNWKQESDGKSALLVEGARRVGKSTIVETFAKNEYESYLLIECHPQDYQQDSQRNHILQ